MMQFLLEGNRLGWPVVFAVVFLTMLLLCADLVWRTTKLRGRVLALGALAVGAVGVSLIFKFG